MTRFFAAPTDISGGTIRLSAEDSAHIRSLRLRPSELFIVCDGNGLDHLCRLEDKTPTESGNSWTESGNRGGRDNSFAVIVETRPSAGEPSVSCEMFIAFAKAERLDYAVQKSVELGAFSIVLFPSARSVSLPHDAEKKAARLQRVALETAKQCGRGRVPAVSAAESFDEAVLMASGLSIADGKIVEKNKSSEIKSSGTDRSETKRALTVNPRLSLFLYEGETGLHLKKALENSEPGIRDKGLNTISIMTGPEGGFEPSEAEAAAAAGMTPVTLGPRILRCETAPVAALAAVMFYTGNM